MIAALGIGLLGLVAIQSAPPDISGHWTGDDWGHVVLKRQRDGSYDGTYTDVFGRKKGKLRLDWSQNERRFKGNWREGGQRFGRISLRLAGNEIRGAWTASEKSRIDPGIPELADLLWVRHDPLAGNVALSSRGATVDGPASHPQTLLDGKTTGYHGTRGWARSLTPATWIVTLPQKYPLQQIRLLLYDKDSRAFRYTIETSTDGKEYEMVADHSQKWSRSWQVHACPGNAVKYIRLQCLDSTYNDRPREDGFFAVELEAYCRPPGPDSPQSGSTVIQHLRQIGVEITEKNGVATDFAIGNSKQITDADLTAFQSLGSLESVTLINCQNVTNAGLAHLKHLKRLQQLNLSPSNITDVGLANVKDMKDLWMLGLNSTRVTDAGLKHLIDNRNITVLYLNNTKITDEGLTFLEQMTDMTWMDLGGTAITDVGLAHLGHMSKLRLLSVDGTKITDAGLKRLERFSNLELINLNRTAVTDAGMPHLAKLSSLKRLLLSDTRVTHAGLLHLAALKNLAELQLLNSRILPVRIEELRKRLPQDCKVEHRFLGP